MSKIHLIHPDVQDPMRMRPEDVTLCGAVGPVVAVPQGVDCGNCLRIMESRGTIVLHMDPDLAEEETEDDVMLHALIGRDLRLSRLYHESHPFKQSIDMLVWSLKHQVEGLADGAEDYETMVRQQARLIETATPKPIPVCKGGYPMQMHKAQVPCSPVCDIPTPEHP